MFLFSCLKALIYRQTGFLKCLVCVSHRYLFAPNYLKVLIYSGLLLSFLLVSCSDDKSNSKGNGTTNGNSGATGATSGSTDLVAPDDGPAREHWISSVLFQRIEKGIFTMGSLGDESGGRGASDENQVQVSISKPFEIMTTEVTQSHWLKVMESNPSRFNVEEDCGEYDSENNMCPNHPVERVSWNDVQEYIKKLNESLKLTGCNGTPSSSAGCYRLPTEAEWEYATRGGTTDTPYSFDSNSETLKNYAWYSSNADGKTHKVGSRKANPYNLYDVHGNVWEWVQDIYTNELPGGKDPLYTHHDGTTRVIRGGSYNDDAEKLRSAYRNQQLWSIQ